MGIFFSGLIFESHLGLFRVYLRVSSSTLIGSSSRVYYIFVSGGVIYASGGALVSAANLYLHFSVPPTLFLVGDQVK